MSVQNAINGGFLSLDAFYRGRVSMPYMRGEGKHLFNKRPDLFDEKLIGTGASSFVAADALVSLTTAANNDAAIRQTFQAYAYQAGKSQLGIYTFDRGDPEANIVKRCGSFRSSSTTTPWAPTDGLWLESSSSVWSFNIGKAGVLETAVQASWNLDKLDGTGPSKVTLDKTKAQIMFVDFEWLGVGTVAFGFFIDRVPIYCHYFHHANRLNLPWVATPNLPIRYEIRQTGAGSGTFKQICSSIISEGGADPTGIVCVHDTNMATFASSGVTVASNMTVPLLGLRLQAGRRGVEVVPLECGVMAGSAANLRFTLLLNPTLTASGGSSVYAFTYGDKSGSNLQVATLVPTGTQGSSVITEANMGTPLDSDFASQSSRISVSSLETGRRLGIAIDGTQDTLVLAVTNLSNANAAFIGRIKWREIF